MHLEELIDTWHRFRTIESRTLPKARSEVAKHLLEGSVMSACLCWGRWDHNPTLGKRSKISGDIWIYYKWTNNNHAQTGFLAALQNCLTVANQGLLKLFCALLTCTQLWWNRETNKANKSSAWPQSFCLVSIDCKSILPPQKFERDESSAAVNSWDRQKTACVCGLNSLCTSFRLLTVNDSPIEPELEVKGCSVHPDPARAALHCPAPWIATNGTHLFVWIIYFLPWLSDKLLTRMLNNLNNSLCVGYGEIEHSILLGCVDCSLGPPEKWESVAEFLPTGCGASHHRMLAEATDGCGLGLLGNW